jgi:putative SOS response-associated peptidase YedK
MCGRVKLPNEVSETKEILKIQWGLFLDYQPRYNVAPTTMVPVVTSANGERTLRPMRWGLIPAWTKDAKALHATFNARSETVAAKPMFRGAWKAGRRCLIVTDGFYEWRKSDKQPFCIALGNKQPMLMVGLWEEWKPKDAEAVLSCTIVTTDANVLMGEVHNRMPVIVGPEDWAAWLGEEPIADPAALLKPFPAERMTMWPVDKRIGNVKNQGPELAEPIALGA